MEQYFTFNEFQESIEKILKTFLLCHNCYRRYQTKTDSYICQSPNYEEHILLDFIKSFGYEYIKNNHPDHPTEYTVKEKGEMKKYDILGLFPYTEHKRIFSIVVKDNETEEYKVLIKGFDDI